MACPAFLEANCKLCMQGPFLGDLFHFHKYVNILLNFSLTRKCIKIATYRWACAYVCLYICKYIFALTQLKVPIISVDMHWMVGVEVNLYPDFCVCAIVDFIGYYGVIKFTPLQGAASNGKWLHGITTARC